MTPSLKQKILDLLSDGQFHSMFEMVRFCNQATSISQRIGDMIRVGIVFERRHFGSRRWEWRLITPVDRIDFQRASLKIEPASPIVGKSVGQAGKRLGKLTYPEFPQAGSQVFLPPMEPMTNLPNPQPSAPPLLQMEIKL